MTATIIQMSDVKPKQASRKYKGCKIILTYLPPTKKWKWEIEMTQIVKYSEEANTMNAGFKAAEKYIDYLKQGG